MSGYKRATVTISEEEYRHLHQADIKRRFKEHSKTAKAFGQAADFSNTLQEMEHRQQQLEQTLNDIGQDFDWIGTEMMQDVLAQNARCYGSLATIIEETTTDANASFALLSQRIADEMQREREHYHHHLQSVVQRLDTYEQREYSRAEVARRWLKQSVALADLIQEQFEHERFLPGRVSMLLDTLNFAQNNLAQGFFEASLQASQQIFLQLSELRFELEQRTIEWQREYARAQSALTEFIAELEMNSKVNAFGLEGEELTEQVDLAYWSNGKYRELLDKCRQLLMILSHERHSITTEELKQTYKELLPVILEKFEAVIYNARLNALNSQLRMNIAERALQALETQGFKLSGAGYANKDMRAAFTANLENPDGSRVMIEVLPAEKTKQELTNELVVITNHPYLKTEHEARLQWQELCRTLNEYDLHVSRPEIHSAPPLIIADPVEKPSAFNEPLIRSKRHHNVR
jgi:hypothetical protein